MTLELRVLTGTRAGTSAQYDKTVVAIGRHALSDLRFDPQAELDVSTRHAEIRLVGAVWTLYDEGSTNGTYVNGSRVANDRRLSDGDVISFGANGPKVEVRGVGSAAPAATQARPSVSPNGAAGAPVRLDTGVRVAHAVREETASMRRVFIGAVGALLVAGVLGFVFWQKQTSQLNTTVQSLIARAESSEAAAVKNIAAARVLDPAFAAKLEEYEALKRTDLARAKDLMAGGGATKSEIRQISQSLTPSVEQPSIAQMNLTKINTMNAAAVAFLVADLDSVPTAGTAFAITPSGLMVTNKHVVRAESGRPASRLAIKFANTSIWISAHIVRMSDSDDLALVQLDSVGRFPVVAGVSRVGALADVGAPIAQIGYPHANDAPMKGSTGGLNFTAATTMAGGHVSKRLDDVLQIDSYAGHGASGSPVFDTAGDVVGVVYGGVRESSGRIVLAVPSARLAAFLASDGAGILR